MAKAVVEGVKDGGGIATLKRVEETLSEEQLTKMNALEAYTA